MSIKQLVGGEINSMSLPKVDRNKEILRLRDEEGRLFWWITKYINNKYGKVAQKNVQKIYHREKAKQSLEK